MEGEARTLPALEKKFLRAIAEVAVASSALTVVDLDGGGTLTSATGLQPIDPCNHTPRPTSPSKIMPLQSRRFTRFIWS